MDGFVVTDFKNNAIRVVGVDGSTATLAGSQKGKPGYADGVGATARFYGPAGIAAHPDGGFVVCDCNNHRLRHVTLDGVVSVAHAANHPEHI